MRLPQEIIRDKRDRRALDPAEIADFVKGIADGSVTEGQVAALAMAVFLNGMSRQEAVALTLAMRDSGDVLDWSDLGRPVADKHSTGGVGDNVSLMLAPIVAACGVAVPMISGRGLGHTGGTLDKMDSIPGYATQPDNETFRKVVREVGAAIIGQTGDLAPADKRFYAIRDTTATVESIPLITASILSKKLAAGLHSLTLDVKSGNGAFMASHEKAVELAKTLVSVARGAGLAANALLTDMSEPLADCAGNAVEVRHAVDFLTGRHRQPRMDEVVIGLAADMLMASGVSASLEAGAETARQALASGRATDVFSKMVSALGGPADFVEKMDAYLPAAPVEWPVKAPRSGVLAACDTRAVGIVVVELGGGRRAPGEGIDHAVGITEIRPVGTSLEAGEPFAVVHARSEADAERAALSLVRAYAIAEEAPPATSPILGRIA